MMLSIYAFSVTAGHLKLFNATMWPHNKIWIMVYRVLEASFSYKQYFCRLIIRSNV